MMNLEDYMKVCSKCGERKHLSFFYPNIRNRKFCIECGRKAHSEKRRNAQVNSIDTMVNPSWGKRIKPKKDAHK